MRRLRYASDGLTHLRDPERAHPAAARYRYAVQIHTREAGAMLLPLVLLS